MRMPNNPNSWPDLYEVMHSWLRGETPIGAVMMACGMAVIRIAYSDDGWKKMVLEGLLCGALTLTFASALEYLDIPKSISIAIGGGIGFIGVDAFRAFGLRFIGNRFGVNDDKRQQRKPLVMSLLMVFFWGGWWCGGITTTKNWELKWSQHDAAYAKATVRREQAEREDSQRRLRDIAALDAKYTGELADAKAVSDKLQSDVAAGRKRLRINARCMQQSSTGTASMDDAATAKLTDAAERDYFTLRQRIDTAGKQIAGLQQYIREQCSK